jgi:hypothetical protein
MGSTFGLEKRASGAVIAAKRPAQPKVRKPIQSLSAAIAV